MSKAEVGCLELDGSAGEGGGQILRSSLSLSAALGRPVHLTGIRAGRAKPGLLRQHLTALQAAVAVSGAEVEGATLGSQELSFRPGGPRHGAYSFSVGTAGSATLVLQTILPILVGQPGESRIEVEGGTHNPLAPPWDFLEHVYFPLLRQMGVEVEGQLTAPGFYPAGGGRVLVRLSVPAKLKPLEICEPSASPALSAWIWSSQLRKDVIEREVEVLARELELNPEQIRRLTGRSSGPGNAVCVKVGPWELASSFGMRGKPAEAVALEAVQSVRAYLSAEAPVGEHLADQLVLLLGLYGGAMLTGRPSSHTTTNVETIRRFLGSSSVQIEAQEARHRFVFPGIR